MKDVNKQPAAVAAMGFKKPIVFLWLWASFFAAMAQERTTIPQAKQLTTFRFEQLTGGIILLRGTLDHFSDSLNFILDSGSGGISLDSGTVEHLRLPITPSKRTIRGIAGIRPLTYALNHTLRLPGLNIDSLDFHINDYSLLSSVYGIRIDGIIGYSVLRRYIVHIDYNEHLLRFYKPGAYRYPKGGTILHPSFSQLPMQAATLKDARLLRQHFYLDTGGGLCLLLPEALVRDSSLFFPKKKMLPTLTEGLGGKKEMMITTVKELRLGPYKFKKVPTYVFDDEFNVTSYPQLGGLIGADLLRRFNITMNYPRAEIHLVPNKHFREPFDYSYSGMELVFEEGNAVVAEVIKGSPAATCGMLAGDVIFAINNVIGISFQNIKTLLQHTDKKIKIIVMRKGSPLELIMKMDRIY